MPEYSTPKVTPTETTKIPGMNGNSSGYIDAKDLLDIIRATFGQANGVATLGPDGRLTSSQLPALADDVIVATSYATLDQPGMPDKLYITADNNKMYRWDDTLATPDYVELSVDLSAYATKAELAAEESAREAEDTNLKNAIDANTARIENLEQEHGGLVITQYRGTNAVPSGKAKNAKVVDIVGKSRGWNNECKNGNFADDSEWNTSGMSVSYSNNKATLTTSSVSAFYQYVTPSIIQGHKYLYCANIETTASSVSVGIYRNSSAYAISSYSSSKFLATGIADIAESTSGYTFDLRIRINVGGSSTTVVSNVILRDLTLIFPEGVPSTVAECVQKCPDILKWDSFGYSMVDTVVEGVKSVGVNIWDEEWEVGGLNVYSGANDPSNDNIRSANYIPLVVGESYYVIIPANVTMNAILFYGEAKDYLGIDAARGMTASGTLTIPPSARFMRFQMNTAYGTTYNHDIQICLNSYADKTTYHPHMESTLSLPSPVILRSAGSIYTDELDVESGVPTRKSKEVDFSTITFGESGGIYYAQISDLKELALLGVASNYLVVNKNAPDLSDGEMNVGYNANYIQIKTSSTPTGKLVYPLATPNTEASIGTSNPMIQTEGGGTINTKQTQTPQIDNCLDVAYLAL